GWLAPARLWILAAFEFSDGRYALGSAIETICDSQSQDVPEPVARGWSMNSRAPVFVIAPGILVIGPDLLRGQARARIPRRSALCLPRRMPGTPASALR